MTDTNFLLTQNLSYNQSLFIDQLRDIQKDRAEQRQKVEKIFISKIPQPLERLLTRDQARIYRLYQMAPSQLTENERIQAQRITANLNRLRSGGCYNLSDEQEKALRENERLFSFNIPNIEVTFCIDIAGPIQNELVNVTHKMVDIFIEDNRYPFDEVTSQVYLDRLIQLGVNPSMFPQMRFSTLENTETEIQSLMLQLHPELIT